MSKASWTREDDLLVCTSYLAHGTDTTDELRDALSGHEAGSIKMRLQNFHYLATGGAAGLANSAALTREVWETVQKLRRP